MEKYDQECCFIIHLEAEHFYTNHIYGIDWEW